MSDRTQSLNKDKGHSMNAIKKALTTPKLWIIAVSLTLLVMATAAAEPFSLFAWVSWTALLAAIVAVAYDSAVPTQSQHPAGTP